MLLLSLGVGVVGGWLVLETGGIGAAILGHAVTRFAIFLATGHAGQVRPPGWEPEEEAGVRAAAAAAGSSWATRSTAGRRLRPGPAELTAPHARAVRPCRAHPCRCRRSRCTSTFRSA